MLLVRHGRTVTTGAVLPGRAPGLHLSEKGRAEALAVGERLRALRRLAAIYTSPMERARETAEPIATARRLEARVEPDLTECHYGRWTGMDLRTLRKKPEWRLVQRYPSGFRFPEGESFTEMQTRITTALARLVADHPGETIVAVSHADPIKAAVAHALGTHLDLFQRIVISTGSVTAVAYGPAGPAVLTVNAVGEDLTSLTGR